MTALRNRLSPADPITGRGIEKHFGAQTVLRGLDLDIPAGQFIAIIGRSGCGKSTLLRLIAGLDTPTDGTLMVGDADAADANATRLMFQEPRLLPWASVLRNVEVGLGQDRRKPGALGRALEVLKSVGLDARAHDWPSVLSGGQKQRVALARALVSHPRVLALDEPLGALDALTRIEMQGLLERVWQVQGFTAVLVTHDVSEALALADRVILIENGGIALDLDVPLPRPRRRGSIALAQLEERILKLLLKNDPGTPEYMI